jgi:hypothetical protein
MATAETTKWEFGNGLDSAILHPLPCFFTANRPSTAGRMEGESLD